LGVEASSPCLRIRRSLIAARIAIARGDPGRAMSLAAAAARTAGEEGEPITRAAAAWVVALVHFAVSDLDAVERDLTEALAVAREARDPQRAIRVRLLRAEVERARGRPAAVTAQLSHLRRLVAAAPAIVRTRWELATTLSGAESGWPDVIAKHVKS